MAARCLIAFVFLASVAGKLRNRASRGGFVSSVRVLAGWPTGPVRLLAVVVVAVEAAVPILLAVPGAGTAALVLAAVTLVVFTAVIARALRRGTTATCNCFGPAPAPAPLRRRHVVRNVLLLAVVATAALVPPASGPVHPGGFAVAALAAVVVAALVVRFDDVADVVFPAQHPHRGSQLESGSKSMEFLTVAVVVLTVLFLVNFGLLLAVLRRLREHEQVHAKTPAGRLAGRGRLEPGARVGDFEAVTTDGQSVSRKQLRGRTLIGCFSPECPPCVQAMPEFIAYARTMPGGRDQVLAVVLAKPDAAGDMERELSEVARVVTGMAASEVLDTLPAEAMPTVYLVDQHGTVEASGGRPVDLPLLASA